MATLIAETDVRGRLGTYTIEIYDLTDTADTIKPFSVESDVVIEWGETGRDYPGEVLRSYCRLSVREGATDFQSLLEGSFDQFDFPTRISGPGVDWVGFPEPSEQAVPYSTRVSPVSYEITLTDGFSFARNNPIATFTNDHPGPVQIANLAKGPGSGEGLSFDNSTLVRWEGVFTDENGNRYDPTTTVAPLTEDSVGLATIAENQYKRYINWLRASRSRVYRSLSEGLVVSHPLRETGVSLDYYEQQGATTQTTTTRSQQLAEITTKDVLGNLDRAFQGLIAAGTVQVDLTDYTGLSTIENPEAADDFDLGGDYNLARSSLSDITTNTTGTATVSDQLVNRTGRPRLVLGDDTSTDNDTITIDVGTIDPTSPLGVVVDWNVNDINSNPTLTVEIDYGAGTDAQETAGRTNTRLIGTIDASSKTISVRFIGHGVEVYPRIRYVDFANQVIDTLILAEDDRSLKTIELEPAPMPGITEGSDVFANRTAELHEPGVDDAGTSDGSSVDAFDNRQPFLVQGALESAYRPFGLLTLQTRLSGLYGPETALLLDKPDGNQALFVCGQGRAVNLTTGTTRVSDVELPTAILPGGALPTPP